MHITENDPQENEFKALSDEILKLSDAVDEDGSAENINKMVEKMVQLNILCENSNQPILYDAALIAKLRGFASKAKG